MTERPILMSAPMVRAVLDGTKTQTRRAIRPQPTGGDSVFQFGYGFSVGRLRDSENAIRPIKCPFGVPGDRLWVREAWQPDPPDDGTWAGTSWRGCVGAALSEIPERFRRPEHCLHRANWSGLDLERWRPSIHMPRWASRLTLEIVAVRVERLQDISEADFRAEGGSRRRISPGDARVGLVDCWSIGDSEDISPRGAFELLWDSLGGDWQANPWVWVVEFRQC